MSVRSHFPLELSSARLRLREFEKSDLEAVQQYSGDPVAVEHLPFGPNELTDTEAYLERALASARATPRRTYEVAITELSGGRLIGAIRLSVRSELHRDASLGYFLRRDLWGRGLVTEAATLLVGFGFDQLRLHRIWATCSTANVGSARVLEKLGMRREAHLREDVNVREHWRDSHLYAVLASEWGR